MIILWEIKDEPTRDNLSREESLTAHNNHYLTKKKICGIVIIIKKIQEYSLASNWSFLGRKETLLGADEYS